MSAIKNVNVRTFLAKFSRIQLKICLKKVWLAGADTSINLCLKRGTEFLRFTKLAHKHFNIIDTQILFLFISIFVYIDRVNNIFR